MPQGALYFRVPKGGPRPPRRLLLAAEGSLRPPLLSPMASAARVEARLWQRLGSEVMALLATRLLQVPSRSQTRASWAASRPAEHRRGKSQLFRLTRNLAAPVYFRRLIHDTLVRAQGPMLFRVHGMPDLGSRAPGPRPLPPAACKPRRRPPPGGGAPRQTGCGPWIHVAWRRASRCPPSARSAAAVHAAPLPSSAARPPPQLVPRGGPGNRLVISLGQGSSPGHGRRPRPPVPPPPLRSFAPGPADRQRYVCAPISFLMRVSVPAPPYTSPV